eukprot:gene8026-8676_t
MAATTTETYFPNKLKFLLLGNTHVGKTNILLRFSSGTFSENFISTIGIDFKYRDVEIDGEQVKLQIWDTAGQERFRSVSASFYRGSHAIFLIYDITDHISFDAVSNWMAEIEARADKEVIVVLLGNKCDLEDERTVPFAKGKSLADRYGIRFYETSAKSGVNIEAVFMSVASDAFKMYKPDRVPIPTQKRSTKSKSCGCS